jgi:hypothetical protein
MRQFTRTFVTGISTESSVILSAPTLQIGSTSGATVKVTASGGDTVCNSSNRSVNPDVINLTLLYSAEAVPVQTAWCGRTLVRRLSAAMCLR